MSTRRLERNQQVKFKTCRRIDTPGDAHSLTFSCFKRRPFLSRDRSRRWFIDAIEEARAKHDFHIWAYVLMPEHVHLLIYPTRQDYSISEILKDIKRPVARQALRFVKATMPGFLEMMHDEQPNGRTAHRFWQPGGGYDRNIASPKIVRRTIDYIHANPVRRGLVDLPEHWYWSSARYYVDEGDVPLRPDVETLPDL